MKMPIPFIAMSTIMQTAPTIIVQTATIATMTTQTPKQCIATAINMGLKRNPRSGPSEGREGSSRGGGPPEGGAPEEGQLANPN
jgi:hypothetical protein